MVEVGGIAAALESAPFTEMRGYID